MRVKFWGTRGSIPVALPGSRVREKIVLALEAAQGRKLESRQAIERFIDEHLPFHVRSSYGGNTTCVEVGDLGSDEYMLIDAGSGIREFSRWYLESGRAGRSATFHIFITHLHWDHVQGFPFFAPAFIPGNRVIFHGHHEAIPQAFQAQMETPFFPVPMSAMAADVEFDVQPYPHEWQLGSFRISTIEQDHPGVAYGYRFESDDRIFVFSSDSEHKDDADSLDYRFIPFFKRADLLVFDAQYSFADARSAKENWGHSSNIIAVELAARALVRHLVIFHHEPGNDDKLLDEFLFNTRVYADIHHSEKFPSSSSARFPRKISIAYDGYEVVL